MKQKQIKKLLAVAGLVMAASAYCEAVIQSKPQPLTLTQSEMDKLSKLFPSTDSGAEHVLWDKAPINVVLPIGKERLVTFPAPVDFGYDISQLPATKLTAQNNNGTVYLTAHEEFSPQRVQARLLNTGKIILLDVSARKEAAKAPIVVSTASSTASPVSPVTTASPSLTDEADTTLRKPISMAGLTRYAIQQLYAPKRLMPALSSIFRTPMKAQQSEPLLLDGSVIAHPLASWRSDNLFVTAVELRNLLPNALSLDPRNLCGSWRAATFFPRNQLSAKGSMDDSTTVFLVSDKSFGQAIAGCHPERGEYAS